MRPHTPTLAGSDPAADDPPTMAVDVTDAAEGTRDSGDSTDHRSGAGSGIGAGRRTRTFGRVIAYVLLPATVMASSALVGYVKWWDSMANSVESAGTAAVQAAKDGAIALLGYEPDSVARDLPEASGRLTGVFRDSYTALIHDVVIPASEQKHIAVVATVPAAGLVSVSDRQAVALVYVDQSTTVGTGPATTSSSTLRITLTKVGDNWLISGFDPL